MKSAFKVVSSAIVTLGIFKVYKHMTDKKFRGRTLPKSERESLIDKHIANHGLICNRCEQQQDSRKAFHVDHIRPYSKDGVTSVNNSQVICAKCNLKKSSKMTIIDRFRGLSR